MRVRVGGSLEPEGNGLRDSHWPGAASGMEKLVMEEGTEKVCWKRH